MKCAKCDREMVQEERDTFLGPRHAHLLLRSLRSARRGGQRGCALESALRRTREGRAAGRLSSIGLPALPPARPPPK